MKRSKPFIASTVSQQFGICILCGQTYDPLFTANGQHRNCPERIRRTAPELLEACKIAEKVLFKHDCKYHGPMVCDKCVAVRIIKTAIVKAGGSA